MKNWMNKKWFWPAVAAVVAVIVIIAVVLLTRKPPEQPPVKPTDGSLYSPTFPTEPDNQDHTGAPFAPTAGQDDPTTPVAPPVDNPTAPTTGKNDPTSPTSGKNDPTSPTSGKNDPTSPTSGKNDPTSPTTGKNPTSPTTGQDDPTTPTEPTEPPEIYERWLGAGMLYGLALTQPEFEPVGVYLTGHVYLRDHDSSQGVYVVYIIDGQRLVRHSVPMEQERKEPGTMDLFSPDLGFATFDLVEAPDFTGMEFLTLDDLTEELNKAYLVTVYEH